jgi:hydroxypyruvate isomerase
MDRRSFVSVGMAGALSTALPSSEWPRQDPAQDKPGKTPHTKFAVNVEMWWGRLPFLERVKEAIRLGFPAIEFWPWRNKDLDALAALCQESGLVVAQFTAWGFSPGLNDKKNHDRFVKDIEEGCAAAKKIGCKMMTVVGGNDIQGVSQEAMHDAIVEGLKRAAPIAEANDVMLILEPMNIRVDHKGHCLYGSAPAIAICERVGSSHVKINWDLYHMQITEGDLCRRIRQGVAQVGYVQLADNPGRHEPGTGEVNYTRVLQELEAIGYRGYVGLECSPRDGEATAAERVRLADTW